MYKQKGRPTGRPFTCTSRSGLCAWSRSAALPHALGDDSDLLNPRALSRIDHVDDVAIPQRAVATDEHRLVFAVLADGAKPFFELGELDVLVVDRDLLIRRVLQHLSLIHISEPTRLL